jgi:hypothetical protein
MRAYKTSSAAQLNKLFMYRSWTVWAGAGEMPAALLVVIFSFVVFSFCLGGFDFVWGNLRLFV